MAAPTIAPGDDENNEEGTEEPETPTEEPTPDSTDEPASTDTDGALEDVEEDLEDNPADSLDVTREDVEEGNVGMQMADLSGDDEDEDEDEWIDGIEDFDPDNETEDDTEDNTSTEDTSESTDDALAGMPGDEELSMAADKLDNLAAKIAVRGLEDDDEKEEIQGELEEIFDLIGLGNSWVDFLEEYILQDMDEDVDPATRAFGTTVVALMLVIYYRPDGDEIANKSVESASTAVQKIKKSGGN